MMALVDQCLRTRGWIVTSRVANRPVADTALTTSCKSINQMAWKNNHPTVPLKKRSGERDGEIRFHVGSVENYCRRVDNILPASCEMLRLVLLIPPADLLRSAFCTPLVFYVRVFISLTFFPTSRLFSSGIFFTLYTEFFLLHHFVYYSTALSPRLLYFQSLSSVWRHRSCLPSQRSAIWHLDICCIRISSIFPLALPPPFFLDIYDLTALK